MGETLLGNSYGLTPDELLKAHQVLTASTAIKRTPYQLDLVTKDRKPDIVPKVGDKVKIKSREWYETWKNGSNYVNVSQSFTSPMAEFCGKILTVEEVLVGYFTMKEDKHKWSFSPEMFEEVYSLQEQLSSKFPKIDLNSPYLYQSPYEVKGSDTTLVKHTDFASKVEETAKRLTAYTLIQGLDDKPKLKQIKTTHLIKLKKL